MTVIKYTIHDLTWIFENGVYIKPMNQNNNISKEGEMIPTFILVGLLIHLCVFRALLESYPSLPYMPYFLAPY